MKKICVFIGSRANLGRLKSVCKAITEHPQLELQLIVGASGLWNNIEYPVNAKIQCLMDGDNCQAMVQTGAALQMQIGGHFEALKPDIVLVHGDRYEVLDVAQAASYMNIPLSHTEGGEDTGTIDDKIRYAISSLADIHFPVTQKAANKLKLMGCKNVYVVGSTALDTIKDMDLPNNRKPYIVVLYHPNTTDPEPIEPLIEAVKEIDIHKVWVNPNVDAGSKRMLKLIHEQKVEFVKDLPLEEYIRLIYNSKCLVGNTSSGIKEGAFLGIPYVCVGNRQQDREKGHNVITVPCDSKQILGAVLKQMDNKHKPDYRFGDGTAAKRIVEVLCSY